MSKDLPVTNHPKLFVSYSWSSKEHQEWVIKLAIELREAGVDVVLDKWDLREGNDAIAFMEQMVSDPEVKKVIMICDRIYVDKANGRDAGVGVETQIISPEIYAGQDQNKFVAVISEKDENGKPYLPIYYKSRIYIDLSNSDLYSTNFEQQLRWIYDKPLYIKPEIGTMPTFLLQSNTLSLGTTTMFKRALDAIRNNKEYAQGALTEYFSTFVNNLERFRITDSSGEFDDKVIESIENFMPFRNEAIEMFFTIAQYRNPSNSIQQLHRFFENLIPFMQPPKGTTAWNRDDFDNFKFIIHELFLYAISCLLKYDNFQSIGYLLRNGYYIERNADYGKNTIVSFPVFRELTGSLNHRNKRLNLGKISLQAELLINRSRTSGITDSQLMQTDFILFIRDCLDSLRDSTSSQSWWPITLVYAERLSGPFEVFARAQSKEYFDSLKIMFDIQSKEDLKAILTSFTDEKLRVPRFDCSSFSPTVLLGFDKLATRP